MGALIPTDTFANDFAWIYHDNKDKFAGTDDSWGISIGQHWSSYFKENLPDFYYEGDFLAKLSDKVSKVDADRDGIREQINHLLESDAWPRKESAQKAKITEIVAVAIRKEIYLDSPLLEQMKYMHEDATKLRDAAPASKEGMLQHINTDIALLQRVFAQDVVKAIDLERAFNGVLNNNIEVLTQAVEDKQLDDWALGNIWKIYYSEYEYVEQAQKEIAIRQKIIDGIKAGLAELQDEDASA